MLPCGIIGSCIGWVDLIGCVLAVASRSEVSCLMLHHHFHEGVYFGDTRQMDALVSPISANRVAQVTILDCHAWSGLCYCLCPANGSLMHGGWERWGAVWEYVRPLSKACLRCEMSGAFTCRRDACNRLWRRRKEKKISKSWFTSACVSSVVWCCPWWWWW